MAAHGIISSDPGESDADGSLSNEQPQAALDAEAFLNSIQDAPGGFDDGLNALLIGGNATATPAAAAAAPPAAKEPTEVPPPRSPAYGSSSARSRYNPVAPYNPLARPN
eukprot:scaffold678326_cov48-Prasinocladus_malaysianus.AAC.1